MAKRKKKEVSADLPAESLVEAEAPKPSDVPMAAVDEAIRQNAKEAVALNGLKKKKQEKEVFILPRLNHPVRINGRFYRGGERVGRGVAEMIAHAGNARRMRLLREKVRNEYEIQSLIGGGIHAKLVNQSED